MLLHRDYVQYITKQLVQRLVAEQMIEVPDERALLQRFRAAMTEELSVEDRINEEVRSILEQHQDEMRRTGASYQEMYKRVKNQLVRERKLILR
jgi:hypothetical protein